MTVSRVLILVSVVLFALAVFGVGTVFTLATVPLGLCFFAAGHLL